MLDITPKIEQFVDSKMKSFKMDNQTGGSVLENLNQKNLSKAEQRRFARLKLTEKLKQQSIQFIQREMEQKLKKNLRDLYQQNQEKMAKMQAE